MNSTVLVINGAIVLFYAIMFILGYKKGFVLQLFDLIGLIVIAYLAWFLSPVLSSVFQIWPRDMIPLQETMFGDAIYSYINQFVWFIIVFIGLKIVLMLIRPIIKFLQNIPVLKQVNKIAGSLFSFVYSTVWVILIAFILTLPIIDNGEQYVEQSWMRNILDGTTTIINELEEPLMKNMAIAKLLADSDSLTDVEQEQLKNWFEENQIDGLGN